MGVINIRMRSERLDQIGAIRSPMLDTGAAQAAQGYAAAARETARGIRGIGEGLMDVAKAGAWWVNHEHQIRYDRALSELRTEFNDWMNGDGETPGKMQLMGSDPKKWAEECNDKYRELLDKKLKDNEITSHEWQSEVKNAAEPFREQWANRISQTAFSAQKKNAITAADTNLESLYATLKDGDGSPELYSQWGAAVVKSLDARQIVDPDARAAILRANARKMCDIGVNNFVTDTEAQADADPDNAEKLWKSRIEDLKNADADAFFPPNARVPTPDGKSAYNFCKDWAEEGDMETYRKGAIKQLENARDKWTRKRLYQKSLQERESKDAFQKEEGEIFKAPVPQDENDQPAYFGNMANGYYALADKAEAQGLSGLALSYRKTAQALAFKEDNAHDALAAAKTKAEAERLKALREQNYNTALAQFEAGSYYDETSGRWVDINPEERFARAKQMLQSGLVTRAQFAGLCKVAKPALDEEGQSFRTYVLDIAGKLVPSAVHYNPGTTRFELRPTAKVDASTPLPGGGDMPRKWTVKSGRQAATYANLVRAMNVALEWKRVNKKNVEETKKYFDNLVSGTMRKEQQATIDENLDFESEIVKDMKNITRNTGYTTR
mgnify:FL=1